MQISVTRALAELKMLDARITAAITQGVFVAAVRGSKNIPLTQAKSAEQMTTDIKAAAQKVEDLIQRRETIKRAIIVSNGQTSVEIGGQKMTVAEAIEKKSSIKYLEQYYNVLNSQLQSNTYQVNTQNAKVDADIDRRVMAAYGNDKGKVSEDQHKLIADAVKSESQARLLDPLNIEVRAKAVWETYQTFATEVDFALSESNASTKIEVPN